MSFTCFFLLFKSDPLEKIKLHIRLAFVVQIRLLLNSFVHYYLFQTSQASVEKTKQNQKNST